MADRHTQLDKEAMARLDAARSSGDSSGKSGNHAVKPSFDLDKWRKRMAKNQLRPATIRAMEEQVNGRLKRSRKRK